MGAHKTNSAFRYINMLIVKDLGKDSYNNGKSTCNVHTELCLARALDGLE